MVSKGIVTSLGNLVTGEGRKDISSPVGIVQGSSDAAKEGTDSFLWVLGLISLSIALLNLLPFLPLDGGHIVFAIVEGIRGRTVPRAVYERVSIVGIGLVLLLFVIGLTNDIGRLVVAATAAVGERRLHRAEGVRQHERLVQQPVVLRPRHLDRPEREQVRRRPLHVEQPLSAGLLEQRDEPEQRRLRRPGAPVELRLGREEAADPDAVEAAREPLVVPRLDRVRPAELVQPRVGGDEVLVDPAVRPARIGAAADDLAERGVDADLVAAGGPAQRA